jgi:hypothetical protein
MNKCLSLLHVITICSLRFRMASAQAELPQARIVNLSIDPERVVVLHLRPGYVSSVRVLEEVSSVALGDPGTFKADHSEAEPQLVPAQASSPQRSSLVDRDSPAVGSQRQRISNLLEADLGTGNNFTIARYLSRRWE